QCAGRAAQLGHEGLRAQRPAQGMGGPPGHGRALTPCTTNGKKTMKLLPTLPASLLAATALTTCLGASAQDAAIRKTLGERIPQLQQIDEVRPTPMKGLYEVRIGTDLFYTDAQGNYLIQGELIDTRARRNLTEDRITK